MKDKLREYLGWKFDWKWDKWYAVYVWLALYMPVRKYIIRKSQQLGRIIIGYWSGFMSESRGLHWDRKSRYGAK